MSNSNLKPEIYPGNNSPIYVTQPYLPPLDELFPYLEEIWKNKILTNGGPLHQRLEEELCEYLGVKYISLFANATIALVTALQALGVRGEVITTPYSFVATAHSLLWNGLKPVFVDIDPNTLNIDVSKIEAAITPKTTAIMPVHCYGRPCDVDAIDELARTHQLKVIYDAAHAFGVNCHCGSVLNHGDLSVLSFHATKVFNTFEGGAIICPDKETKRRIDQLKNFGFVDEVTVVAAGINGKMSELNAAIGLLQLKHINEVLLRRKEIDLQYRRGLCDVAGIDCLNGDVQHVINHSYFPVLIQDNYPVDRDRLYQILKDENIFARRYFYPLISDFSMYQGVTSAHSEYLPVAKSVAKKVLCLPIYPALSDAEQFKIMKIIREVRT